MSNTKSKLGALIVLVAATYCGNDANGDEPAEVMLSRNTSSGTSQFVEMNDDIETFSRGGFFGEEGVTRKSTRLRTVKRESGKGTANGASRVTLTFDRVAMFMETAQAPASFDSDTDDPTDDADPLAAALGPMLGKSLSFELDNKGQVTASKGIDELYAAVEEAAAGGMLFVQLEEELTDARTRFYWNDSHACLYPNKKVKVGDTWAATSIQPSIYQKDSLRTYQCKVDFIGERDGKLVVDVSYEVKMKEMDDNKGKARMFGMSLSLKDGHAKGTATFDVNRGEYVTQTEEFSMNLVGKTDGTSPGTTRDVESRIKTTHTMIVVTPEERKAQRKATQAS
ncbi:MAG: hypothetical protein DHS20C16_27670 [Phycisphaerae bacterium]|nr:MAG: hypothetical protein DHS20C16_27670 [Phycisphaerae bacterium]